MSEVVYTCECGKVYRINARFAGRTSRCAQCRREYVVPSGSSEISEQRETDDELAMHLLGPDGVMQFDAEEPEPKSTPPRKTFSLGKYEVREKIGEGGMGSIYAAWDTELRREVTVKILSSKGKKLDHFKERFLNEARITGRLEHSGIIPVHVLDYDADGMPYFVMRLLQGRTLSQLIEHYHHSKVSTFSVETLRELLRHFIDVCQTIAYAHDHFIVHRDIKPANIMLSGYGETIVLDWGLAKRLPNPSNPPTDIIEVPPEPEEITLSVPLSVDDENPDLTVLGGRLGTAGYQSPEYLRTGVSQPSDDIYALGATLYHLLCDQLPYKVARDRRGVFEMLMLPPKPPHLINPHVNRQLSAICLCAIAFEKDKRYSRAERLATDLQRWLDGETVSVYRMNWKEKAARLLKKKATWFGIVLAGFLMGLLFARLF